MSLRVQGTVTPDYTDCEKHNNCKLCSYMDLTSITGYSLIIRTDEALSNVPGEILEILCDQRAILLGQDVIDDVQGFQWPFPSDRPECYDSRRWMQIILDDPDHRDANGRLPTVARCPDNHPVSRFFHTNFKNNGRHPGIDTNNFIDSGRNHLI